MSFQDEKKEPKRKEKRITSIVGSTLLSQIILIQRYYKYGALLSISKLLHRNIKIM